MIARNNVSYKKYQSNNLTTVNGQQQAISPINSRQGVKSTHWLSIKNVNISAN
jgi:hypothetical protein